MGKKKVDESDSEDDDNGDDDVKEKSMVLDNGYSTSHDKDEEGISAAGLASSANSNGESSGGIAEQSNLDYGSGASEDQNGDESGKSDIESNTRGQRSDTGDSNSDSDVLVETETVVTEEASAGKSSGVSTSEEMPEMKEIMFAAERPVGPEMIDTETVGQATDNSNLEEPLNFDKYNSAVELEVLGMERFKAELQSRALKCGGTLEERAARLFLLKTTLEKLPKKVLAGKTGGK